MVIMEGKDIRQILEYPENKYEHSQEFIDRLHVNYKYTVDQWDKVSTIIEDRLIEIIMPFSYDKDYLKGIIGDHVPSITQKVPKRIILDRRAIMSNAIYEPVIEKVFKWCNGDVWAGIVYRHGEVQIFFFSSFESCYEWIKPN